MYGHLGALGFQHLFGGQVAGLFAKTAALDKMCIRDRINAYNARMVRKHDMLSQKDVEDILGLSAIGVIPVSYTHLI